MRITFVAPGLVGGGGRVVVEYARGLLERGHEARILHRRTPASPRNLLRSLYLKLRYNNRDAWLRSFGGQVQDYDVLTPRLVGANDAVVAVGADCVLSLSGLPASCGIKVHNCHGRELSNLERMREAWSLPMPRIVVASFLEREMREQGSKDDIYVMSNGYYPEDYYPVDHQPRRGLGGVFHGAYTKGPELMLAVFQKLHEERPDLPLRMFGAYPRPQGLPAATEYVRLPSIAKARDLYSGAQVWICTSRHEGFGLPVLEAMACGCPVVTTACGGTTELVEDGVNGFIVPVDDAVRMRERVVTLLDNADLRARFAAASQLKLKRFTWPSAIDVLEKALKAIIAKAGRG